jgi:hypothetical protein
MNKPLPFELARERLASEDAWLLRHLGKHPKEHPDYFTYLELLAAGHWALHQAEGLLLAAEILGSVFGHQENVCFRARHIFRGISPFYSDRTTYAAALRYRAAVMFVVEGAIAIRRAPGNSLPAPSDPGYFEFIADYMEDLAVGLEGEKVAPDGK